MVKISIKILGEEWEQEGKTIEEALSKFPLSWDNIKGKGVLTVTQGKKSHEHMFNMKVLRRIFSNKLIMAHWAKNLEMLLDVKTNIPEVI